MNAVSVCIAETQSLSCISFTFCIMSLNFHLSKRWYQLYCICMQAWHFRNFQIRASLCSPCHYIFRAYTTKNLKETCTLWMFITKNLSVWWISAYFFLPSTCCGIIFVYQKWPACMWTAQPVCAFSWHADSRKRNTSIVAWFQAMNAVWMRSALFWDFTQRRLVVSCRRFGTTVGGGAILPAVLVKIQVIWDVSPFIFRDNSPRWRH
jgi:hypothetical protein